jgi:ABC-2 type transport system ATP-binding protein
MGELSGLPPMDAMQRAHEVLHYVGIGEERYRPIKTYSTGMQQKVKLAQAIVHDPELVILDEPTNGMDPKGRQEMLDLIRDITRTHKKAIILSSHLLPDVEYVCDHVLIMDQGNIVLQGGLKELTSRMDHYDIRIKGDDRKFSGVLEGMGLTFERSGSYFKIRTDKELLPTLYPKLKGTGIQIRHASRTGLTLEDLFMMKVKGGSSG